MTSSPVSPLDFLAHWFASPVWIRTHPPNVLQVNRLVSWSGKRRQGIAMVHERVLSISHDHPSLAGHFPGSPVVPGVVVLNEVFDTLRGSAASLKVTGLPTVKFSSPLKPGEAVTIRVVNEGTGRATFTCHVDARLVASGAIEFALSSETQTERQ